MGKASKKSVGKGPGGSSGASASRSAPPKAAPSAKSAPPAKAPPPPAKGAKPAVAATGKAPAAKTVVPPAKPARPAAAATPPAVNGSRKAPPPAPVTKASAAKQPPVPAKPAAKPLPASAASAPKPAGRPEASRVETKPDRRDIRPAPAAIVSPVPPPPAGPTAPRVEPVNSSGDSKPKKNQAGLSAKELEFFRDLLLEKRRELIGDMNSMEREALSAAEGNLSTLPIHMADMGTDNYEQEFTLGLVEKDRVLLREINHALAKVQNGSYGICEGNGQPIGKVRLEAQPWARHSIEYVRSKEKRVGGR